MSQPWPLRSIAALDARSSPTIDVDAPSITSSPLPRAWAIRRVLPILAALTVAVGLTTLGRPLLHDGFPAGHDLTAHLTYTHLFDRALWSGQLPVRWTQGVRIGDTQPLFSFYQPGFYYAVELVHLVMPSLAVSLKTTVLALWACGAVFVSRLGPRRRGWMGPALGAAVFASSPYLLLDVNVRAAYPELAAIAAAAGVLWAIDRLAETPGPCRAAWLAALLAAALVCHLPSTLIFCPIFVARTVLGAAAAVERRRVLLWSGAAVLLAAGLSAFYVVPALAERDLVQMSGLTHGYFDYRNHFVAPSQWVDFSWGYGPSLRGAADRMSFQVGIVQWGVIAGAMACGIAAAGRRRLASTDRDLLFWLAVIVGALFMTTAASGPIWRALPPLAYLQFPWRFLMLVAVACGALATNLLARLGRRPAQAALLTAAMVVAFIASHPQRRPSHYVPQADIDIDRPAWSQTDAARKMAFVEPGYYPAGTGDLDVEHPPPIVGGRWTTSDPTARVTWRAFTDHRLALDVRSEAGTDLVLASRTSPAWRVTVDGVETITSFEPPHGFIRVRVPPGAHLLQAELRETALERGADAASAGSAVLFAALLAAGLRRRADRHAVTRPR
jgi:hypothetical protein